jgi:hypothetical protein
MRNIGLKLHAFLSTLRNISTDAVKVLDFVSPSWHTLLIEPKEKFC